ncbi:MAG TPA: phosphoribosylformylglycinamidine cyclo-ligase [Calditerricola sp.]
MSEAYKRAGVDLAAGYEAVRRIKVHVRRTYRPEVLGDIGGFGALFQLDVSRYRQPVLVAGADGVGTKLKIAFATGRHDTIGIDCVAMCANDVVVQGAEPLFFLDYLACGRLDPDQVEAIVKGLADGCAQAGCALVGGETAEMPGFYPPGEYDLAGFCVGVVERDRLVDGSRIRAGDVLVGLASTGLHSNGFSLVRKVLLEEQGLALDAYVPALGRTLGEELLEPTAIYVKVVLALRTRFDLRGMAHITGGGFVENVPRILPPGMRAEIDWGAWPVLPIFTLIEEAGRISRQDMVRTFNMGIGMVLVVPEDEADDVVRAAAETGQRAFCIGRVGRGEGGVVFGGVGWS